MDCQLHPGASAAGACSGCAEPFCANCLVPIRGERYCAACKKMAVPASPPSGGGMMVEDATTALKYAVLGFFCFGVVLGPMAISRATKAKEQLAADPGLAGRGRADAAIVLGAIACVFWLLSIVTRFGGHR